MIAFLAAAILAGCLSWGQTPDSDEGEQPLPVEAGEGWEREGWGFGGLPAVNYNTDEGFGAGAIGTLYRYDGVTAPYRWRLTALVFLTTKGVQSHYLDLDALRLAGGKLRVSSRMKFGASAAENYCGLGSRVTCDPSVAVAEADALGLADEEREDFERRYYRNRIIQPFSTTNVRYLLSDKPHRLELIAGYRFDWLISGQLGQPGPYPGSLYSKTFPEGENARQGVLQFGLMADNRDNEPSPHKGYWVEGTVRGSHPVLGSSPGLAYLGANANIRAYAPLMPEGRLTLANRVIADVIHGNATTQELTWFGGTQLLQGIGGLNAGRGIRQRRYRGPLKAIEQAELRWRFARFDLGFPLELYLLGFGELSYVSEPTRVTDPNAPVDPDASPFHLGEGTGLRVVIDKNFIVRFDFGFSADEDYAMGLYIDIDNLF